MGDEPKRKRSTTQGNMLPPPTRPRRPTLTMQVPVIPGVTPPPAPVIPDLGPPTMANALPSGSPPAMPGDPLPSLDPGPPPMPDLGPPTMANALPSAGGPPPMPDAGQGQGVPTTMPGKARTKSRDLREPLLPPMSDDKVAATDRTPMAASMATAIAPSQGPAKMEPSMATAIAPSQGPGAPPPMPGETTSSIFGAPPEMPASAHRYALGLEIARGGMGRVVEAEDTVLRRTVALKEGLAFDEDSLARFYREIQITARLEHPSIVPVHDAGKGPNNAPFYVMRKIGGKPLEKLVGDTDTLAERLALIPHIVASANAIAHAHERGIVHRDIKPSNILVGELGETIVIDWGLAKMMSEVEPVRTNPFALASIPATDLGTDTIKTRAGIVYGTPGFMAPEQLRGAPADERTDVYALGATLYHLLLRKPPHHAKTADEMMRAAVDGPAKSLVDALPGTPKDLSTIVDKSLAHDAGKRYQNARELAGDLERFLKGQLIASHHYSRGERLRRFWHKHKIAIVGTGVAALAAVAILVISVVRIRNERDLAQQAEAEATQARGVAEKARAEAEDRADALTLANATSLLDINPTLAVASVKRLAGGAHWREVRAIGEGARFAGVAWRGEASPATVSTQFTHDGSHLLTAGSDGVLRTYDLATHAIVKLADVHAPLHAKFYNGEHRIVLYGGKTLITLDASGGDRHEISLVAAVRDLDVVGSIAYLVDERGALSSLNLFGSEPPAPIAFPDKIDKVLASPDHKWLAVAGERSLYAVDVSGAQPRVINIQGEHAHDFSWSTNSRHLTAQVQQLMVDFTFEPDPVPNNRVIVGDRYSPLWDNGVIYSVGPMGVSMAVDLSRLLPRKQFTAQDVGIRIARNNTIIAASTNTVHALRDDADHALVAPTAKIDGIDASPTSPYVIATSEGNLYAWNLDLMQPTQLASDSEGARFTGGNRVLIALEDEPAKWIDLDTHQVDTIDVSAALRNVSGAPNGKRTAIVDVAHHAYIAEPGKPSLALEGQVDEALFLDDDHVLLALPDGALAVQDLRLGTRKPIAKHGAKLIGLSWNHTSPPTAAAAFADGFVWRGALDATGETLELGKPLTSGVAVGADGAVWLAVDADVRIWPVGGKAAELVATVPKPVVGLGAFGDRAVAFAEDGASYTVGGHAFAPLFPLGKRASMSASTGLIVATRGPFLDAIDPAIPSRWALARRQDGIFTDAEISADGRRVLARVGNNLLAWSLDLPTTAAATRAWLDEMTNAYDKGASEIGWR